MGHAVLDTATIGSDRQMRRVLAFMTLAMLCGPALAEEAEYTSLLAGTWSVKGETEVTFAPCEQGECGFLSRLVVPEATYAANKEAIDAMGVENVTDDRNPDPELKKRKVLGLPIVVLSKKVSPVRYEGRVYNPEDGNTYDGIVELADGETLKLTGCAYLIFCQSQEWKRVSEEELAARAKDKTELPGNVGVWHVPEAEAVPAPTPVPAAPVTN